MNAQHTPGPWRALPAKDYTYENGKALKVVATNPAHHSDYKFTAIVYGDMVDGRCEANARLIAAAPDLLRALEAITYCWEKNIYVTDTAMALVGTAIARARGE